MNIFCLVRQLLSPKFQTTHEHSKTFCPISGSVQHPSSNSTITRRRAAGIFQLENFNLLRKSVDFMYAVGSEKNEHIGSSYTSPTNA